MARVATESDFITRVRSNLPFTPTPGQLSAIEKITSFIFEQDPRAVFILKGYAGTGKTNLISAVTQSLPDIKWRSVLLAPTGRAAKVISNYSKRPAFTIHKKIYKKQQSEDGKISFFPGENLHKNTVFIVDEASMINASESEGAYGNLLEDLFEYVYSGENCKIILVGDTAQLPPVGSPESPALDINFLRSSFHLSIKFSELTEVARQGNDSGILYNATLLRQSLLLENDIPKFECFPDFVRLAGDELEDTLNSSISNFGEENVIIITRSNKRANLFNQSYRNRIKMVEEDLCSGDRLMIVKNNYFWAGENSGLSFIANGDMAEISRISRRETIYGFSFTDCTIRLCDYENVPEQEVKIITDCLHSDNPALSQEQQKQLYSAVLEDVIDVPERTIRINYLRSSKHFNALQVKFAYAITCHKSQGGQWPVVFIDQGFLREEDIDINFKRWLYTAITRASEKIYLINFNELFFNN
jgi:exodeoxyribonuclease V